MHKRSRWLWFAGLAGLAAAVYLLQASGRTTPEQGARGIAAGQSVPRGERPAPTPTPRLIWFQKEPYGPVKIEPKSSHVVELGKVERGTQVRAVVSVVFNQRVSNLAGTPDIDVSAEGPTGVVTQLGRARNGTQLAFQTPVDGDYRIVLGNAYSQVNAKQVSLQFLQP
jgi:hypothetical protein